MGENFLSGGIAELEAAKAAVAAEDAAKAAYHAAEAQYSTKEKELDALNKYVSNKINTALRERRGQLKKVHDEQVDAAHKELREAEKQRKNAKQDAVQARINTETSDLNAKCNQLKQEAKTVFKENRVSGLCNKSYYYAMYAPRRGTEFLALIITLILTLCVIPNLVCVLSNIDSLVLRILLYLGIVLFFVLIYFIIFFATKRNKIGAVLDEARPIRDELRKTKKEIKKTSHHIRGDKDESSYGLEGFDQNIAAFQNALNEKSAKRDAALKDFDENTAVQIRTEIQNDNQQAIDQLTQEVEACKAKLAEAKAVVSKESEIVTNNYEIYLGKKNTSTEKIDAMIALIQTGKASSIMEAMDQVNGEIK